MATVSHSEIERVFREQYGRSVAVLVRVFGDIDLAEEAVQDAFTTAVARWPDSGIPRAPAGWIITTARNRAIDRLRRESTRDSRHAQAMLLHARHEPPEESPVQDDRLRLIFNEGYAASSGEQLIREELTKEAIRLGRLLLELMPDESEAIGLLALMLLEQSRSSARTTPEGVLVPLPEQDRSRWGRNLIEEGQELVRRCLRRNEPGPYQIQAAINAVHSDAPTADQTDWSQILALYDQLLEITPTPIVALNRAIAVAELDGPQVGLDLIDKLPLDGYYLYHAIRADLLRRLGHKAQAEAAYRAAIEHTDNAAEIAFMKERISAIRAAA